jgi:hypothetical protein
MTDEQGVVRGRRRTPVEIQQIVRAFAGSGVNRRQFCQRQGLSLGTLNRYLKRMQGESAGSVSNAGLVAVEVRDMKRETAGDAVCGLAVVLSGGRRIEVGTTFDGPTLQRLVQTLEML